MATIKNLWSVHSTGGADSGGQFIFKEFDSSWVGADPTYLGVPLTDGDIIPWNSSNVIINSAGRYEFDYEVSTVNCATTTARLILYLYEVDISDTPDSCNYTGEFKSDGFVSDKITNTTVQNDTDVTWSGTYEILDCDLNVIYSDNFTDTFSNPQVICQSTDTGTWASGGKVNYIRILDKFGTTYDIDLSGITYAGNHTTFRALLMAEFEYQMTALGSYTNGDEYILTDITTSDSNPNVRIIMGCKHNPSGDWFGLHTGSQIEYDLSGGGSPDLGTSVFPPNPGLTGSIFYNEALPDPCSSQSLQYFATLTPFAASYINLVNNAEESLSVGIDNSPQTCNFTELTGTLFPACEVLESYSWAGPSGYSSTDQTIQVSVAGSYTCTIQCGSTICNHTIVI